MLTISKSIWIELIEKLESIWVKWVAFDIIFQNVDPDEQAFALTMKKYGNIVIARGGCDQNGCGLSPLPVYSDVPQWSVAMQFRGDKYYDWWVNDSFLNLAHTLFNLPNYLTKKERDFIESRREPSVEQLLWNKSMDTVKLTPYFGLPNTYSGSSLIQVLKMSKVDLVTNFSGKYIFIWESGTEFHDQFVSPVSGTMIDGVESHAHILDGFLQNRILRDIDTTHLLLFITLLFLAFFTIVLYLFLPKFVSPFIAIGALVLTIFLCRYLYFEHALVIEIFPVLLAVGIFSFPTTFIYRFFIIDREKRMITSAFAHYVDPTLVGEIAEKSGEINLGGESRELSILFSDIAGFTTISEKLAPMDLFSLMSSYLTRMTGILTSHGGTLDKYIGDAVMGFFGAPLTLADHAKRACATALAMREALPEFNTEITARGLEAVDFRVGIASGEVMVGNIGSYDRFNYTVLGDTVNLASRLEATSKEYGTHIIVAEPTYLAAKDDYIFRALDKVAVKGKTEWVMIYELIAKSSDTTLDRSKYTHYEEALTLYFTGKYLEAGQLFEKNMADDAPSRVMAMRCVDILKWVVTVEGGVYKMTHK